MVAFSVVSAQELGAELLDATQNSTAVSDSAKLAAPADSAVVLPAVAGEVAKSVEEPSTEAEAVISQDSSAVLSADSVAAPSITEAVAALPPNSAAVASDSSRELVSPRELKSVLYLGGGEHSVWYHLGVLYAIESYAIPVDSIVGTSWGAYVGYLWAKGVPLDDIQRALLDPYVDGYPGHNFIDDLSKTSERTFELPVSQDGLPCLRHRFTVSADTSGKLKRNVKRLDADTARVESSLARLRLQEILQRAPKTFKIPFAVETCDGIVAGDESQVIASLPLAGSRSSGELCPLFAMPLEDSNAELAIISVSVPVREPQNYKLWNSPWQERLAQKALTNLQSQPGVIVQAHTVLDTSRGTWIQAGFSALERRLTEMAPVRNRAVDYGKNKTFLASSKNLNPTFDSLSAEIQPIVKTYWNSDVQGIDAAKDFALTLENRPAYDSVQFNMLPSGDVWTHAAVAPTFDVFAGGFGSNAIGPHVYGGVSLSYVDQMEFDVGVSGFWGEYSYGLKPEILVSRLWDKSWSLGIDYEWMKLKPLKSYSNNELEYYRIYSEQRSDLHMTVGYQMDALQKISLNFLFGHRTFELNPKYYSQYEFETYPVSPSLRYELVSGENDRWFAEKSYAVVMSAGMQSIGYEFGMNSVIPIYWIVSGEGRFAATLGNVFTVGGAVAGGADFYHEEGYGYVYPESFEYRVLDDCYRQKIRATPWNAEWYDSDLASHGYAMGRVNVGLHYGPVGAWIFGAYVKDFEENPMASLGPNRIVLEPALRFNYKSLSAYLGLSRTVDSESLEGLKHTGQYKYFVRIGNYDFF